MEPLERQLVLVLAELIVSPNTANRKEAKLCIESDTHNFASMCLLSRGTEHAP